jgi:YEATS domain-containing protein 4
MKGYSSCRIVIGSKATRIKNPVTDVAHEWVVYVNAPKHIVRNVQYKLHESFTNNVVLTEYPFELKEHGWGEFTIQIKLILFNDDRLHTSHFLKLHGEGDVVTNETVDEIVFKGIENHINPSEEEDMEYKKIDEGIEYMLGLFKDDV